MSERAARQPVLGLSDAGGFGNSLLYGADIPVSPELIPFAPIPAHTSARPANRTDELAAAFAMLRLCTLCLALGLGALRAAPFAGAPWLALLVLPEIAIRGASLHGRRLWLLAGWWTIVASTGVLFTGGESSPLLPCIAVASFFAGLANGVSGALVANGIVSLVLSVGWALHPVGLGAAGGLGSARHYFAEMTQWVLLGLALGVVGGWITKTSASRHLEHQTRYTEAYALLEQLRSVTSGLPGSLDLTTTCEVLLDACRRQCGAEKGAVLVGTDDEYLVPMAVLGTRRVPWRGPQSGPGPLRQAWETREPVIDIRKPDADGKRGGSALLVVPMVGPTKVVGLLALEAHDPEAFPVVAVERILDTVQRSIIRVETAQLFDDVRSAVTVEERARLATEMHDGVAQDLAFVGFELDALKSRANKLDPALGNEVARLRAQTSSIIADIRGAISDLKSSGSVERGLGSAIASYVRNIGATGRMAVHLSLRENTFRLSAETEVLLFRVLQELTVFARDHAEANNLWVSLLVDPPAVELRVEHDGADGTALKDPRTTAEKLASVGGSLNVRKRMPKGAVAEAVIGGWPYDDSTASHR